MNRSRIYCLLLVSLALLFSPSLVGRLSAHVALGVNGSVSLTIGKPNIVVEYQIECGERTPVNMRRKIDRNGDGNISKKELESFNKTTQSKLAKTKTLCQITVDDKPVKLLPKKVAFILPDKAPAGTIFMKLLLASKEPLPPGPHQLMLTGDICPLDVELLSLPAPTPGHSHAPLLRILKVTATGEPSMQFSKVSSGFISGEGQKKKVQCFINKLVKQVQIDFELGQAVPGQKKPAAKGKVQAVDATTMATPLTLKAPVRISEISTFDALTFDPTAKSSGKISYRLSRPAWVRIRVVLRNDEQIVLRTLVDWSERKAGKQTETWDGRDAAGNLVDKAKFPCFIIIEADSQIHRKHKRALCKDLRLALKLKDSPPEPASGKFGVEVALDKNTRGYGEKLGYKVRAYVDFKIVHSFKSRNMARRGFDFTLDKTGFSTGEHLLTVVVDDGADHVGSASLNFNVMN